MSKEGKRKKEEQKKTVEGGLSKKWRWKEKEARGIRGGQRSERVVGEGLRRK